MNIEATIEQFIIDELVEEKLNRIDFNESLIAAGFLDSVAVLRLIAFFEKQFDITVEENDKSADNFETIHKMTAFIKSKMNKE